MRHLMEYFDYPICGDIVFFGDNYGEGNDAPVENISEIYCVKVQNPKMTEKLLDEILETTRIQK